MTLYTQKGYTHKNLEMVKGVNSFDWLEEKIKTPELATNKKTGATYFLSGTMKNTEREDKNLLTRDLMIFDFDDLQEYELNNQIITHESFKKQIHNKLAKYDYMLYPSYSASKESVQYRLVIKLDRPLNKAEYKAVGTQIAYDLGLPIDLSCIKTWSQVQGVPVQSPTNKDILVNAAVNKVNNSYKTVTAEQFEEHKDTIEDRAKVMVKEIEQRTKPKNAPLSNFDKASYNLTINSEKAYTGQIKAKLDDISAIMVMKEYANHNYSNLDDYNNYLSAEMQLVNAVQQGQITYDAAIECIEILANGNDEWIENNKKRFEKTIEKGEVIRNTDYDFIGKFLLTLPDAVHQKYRHLLPTRAAEEVHHNKQANQQPQTQINSVYEEFLQLDLTQYNYNNLPVKYKECLSPNQRKELMQRTSAKSRLDSLRAMIDATEHAETISTGFPELDKMLEGGFWSGLYCLGAMSSLGKTTFMLQIADNIAKQGKPVMFFSLEQSAHELMLKSLSRLTLEVALQEEEKLAEKGTKYDVLLQTFDGKTYCNASTQRDIQDKKRYKSFTNKKNELREKAFKNYDEYCDNVYIHQGVGDVTTDYIKDAVSEFVEDTGQTPVVIIDYLQIIKGEEKASDKTNTDRAVTHLKQISRDFDIPVIAISSFNRDSYTGEVSTSAFKESGAIEYGADVLIGLQFTKQRTNDKKNKQGNKVELTPQQIDDEKNKDVREIDFKLLKQRSGVPTGLITYELRANYNHFRELERIDNNNKKDKDEVNRNDYNSFNLKIKQEENNTPEVQENKKIPKRGKKKQNCLQDYKPDDLSEVVEQVTKENLKQQQENLDLYK